MHEALIAGPVGNLQVRVDGPAQANHPVVVICHPHPEFGGTLNNKVVHTLARAAVEQGLTAIRFNFRGVGESEGCFDQGEGELDDLLCVMEWARTKYPAQPICLAGFSFGAYIAARAAQQNNIQRLLLVAPSVTLYDMSGINNIPVPWTVIQGMADEIIPAKQVLDWVNRQKRPPVLHQLEGVSHFFHGHLVQLRQLASEAFSMALINKEIS